jgi:hypothetical protein
VSAPRDRLHAPGERLDRGIRDGLGGAGLEQFEPVVADVYDRIEPHDAPRFERPSTRDAGHQRVAVFEAFQQPPGRVRDGGGVRIGDDRRERTVDVKQERRALRLGDEGI